VTITMSGSSSTDTATTTGAGAGKGADKKGKGSKGTSEDRPNVYNITVNSTGKSGDAIDGEQGKLHDALGLKKR
jgi:hypothetical protein